LSLTLGSAPELVSSEDKPAATESGSSAEPDEKDIKLVMDQANVEREKAVKAIKEADGDLINASEFALTRSQWDETRWL
jgi:NACalpha-BTF3-like transcription factor